MLFMACYSCIESLVLRFLAVAFTESLVMENTVVFPIKPELGTNCLCLYIFSVSYQSLVYLLPLRFCFKATGFSHWILQGEKYHGVSLQKSKDEYSALNKWEASSCNVELSEQDEEQNDYTKISPLNMFFPVMFWATFSIIAIILQITHTHIKRKGGRSSTMIGRQSTRQLNASITSIPVHNNDEGDGVTLHETLKGPIASESKTDDILGVGDQRPSWMENTESDSKTENGKIDDDFSRK